VTALVLAFVLALDGDNLERLDGARLDGGVADKLVDIARILLYCQLVQNMDGEALSYPAQVPPGKHRVPIADRRSQMQALVQQERLLILRVIGVLRVVDQLLLALLVGPLDDELVLELRRCPSDRSLRVFEAVGSLSARDTGCLGEQVRVHALAVSFD
jgi:hypothetical protein